MLHIFKYWYVFITSLILVNCLGQTPKIQPQMLSDDFDKKPPFFYKMPENLSSIDTSPGWHLNGQKILFTGTVYDVDGKTPVPNVILYYYQTDINGVYKTKESEERNMPKNKLGQTHGYIRGWVKTDENGTYSIYTVKPGTYPSRNEPAHVHLTIKEERIKEPYYIDDFVFDDDVLLTSKRRKNMNNRGGSGVIRFVQKENLLIGERDIYLGLNIPDYPESAKVDLNSGKNIGEDIMSFTPFHAFGEDKGTKTCPICKYGWYHGILYFVGNNPHWDDIKKWLTFLDALSIKKEKYLKVYFVYGNETDYNFNQRNLDLKRLGNELVLKKVALTFVPSFTDKNSEIYTNKINPNVQNTFIIYKRSNIINKHINLQPDEKNFNRIIKNLDNTTNEYFKLPRPKPQIDLGSFETD
ncbi:intradiol ring-cleavage dioxygenase [Xanthomarina sp. GH4-25]|uniref:dioxygenase family protein n=1 Tax=Xanthomarina sp. GH4-25 TaxID=3349335 RepID=UPI003877939E